MEKECPLLRIDVNNKCMQFIYSIVSWTFERMRYSYLVDELNYIRLFTFSIPENVSNLNNFRYSTEKWGKSDLEEALIITGRNYFFFLEAQNIKNFHKTIIMI